MHGLTRRSLLGCTVVFLSGCSSSGSDNKNGGPETLEEQFESAARNHENDLIILSVDEIDDGGVFVDFLSTAETMDGRAEELSTLLGVYGGVVDSGTEIPAMIAYGLDPDRFPEEERVLWSFTAEQEWVEDWANGEITGDEAVQLASETYEENIPPGEE